MSNFELDRRATPATSAEAMIASHLDWTVDRAPIGVVGGPVLEDKFAVMRSDTKKVLGIVSSDYQTLQNKDAFAWFDPFVSAREATYSTAGSFRDGRIVWVMAKLNRRPSEITRGDVVDKYVLLSNRHDGHGAIAVGFTPQRVVCKNTLAIALRSTESKLLRLSHAKPDMLKNLDLIRATMDMIDANFEATAVQYRALAAAGVDDKGLRAYFSDVFDFKPGDDGELPKRQATVLERLMELHESSPGAEYARGTYWGAYNAATAYLSHERGNSEETRLSSLYMGDSQKTNERALQYAYNLAVA